MKLHPLQTKAHRILVVGSTGSGKTTIARRVSASMDIPLVQLDELFWGPNWTMREQFADEALAWIARDSWVIEGGYMSIAEAAWPRAELVVWLDLPFAQLLSQQFQRTMRRTWRNEAFFGGNRESLRMYFFSTNSLWWWLVKTYRRRKREYSALAQRHPSVRLVRLQNRRAVDEWLATFAEDVSIGVH